MDWIRLVIPKMKNTENQVHVQSTRQINKEFFTRIAELSFA